MNTMTGKGKKGGKAGKAGKPGKPSETKKRKAGPSYPYCIKCEKRFAKWRTFEDHKRTQHSNRILKILCPFWPKCKDRKHKNGFYSNQANLKVHIEKHHKKFKFEDLDPKTFVKVFLRKERKGTYSVLKLRNMK